MSILIRSAGVFDGIRMLDGLFDIRIANGLIESVQSHDPAVSADEVSERVINADGAWLLPGLIDLHVHLTWNGGPDPATLIAHTGFAEHLLQTVSATLQYLSAGVTSVRDLGSPEDCCLHVGRATHLGQIPGPRIFGSGMSLIMTGGHDPFHGMPVDGPWEALKGVRAQVAKGASVIKVSATGGVYGRETGEGVDDTELRPDELDIIIDEAHRRNVKVTAHAIGEQGIRSCLLAGIDCIEHGHFIQEDMAETMRDQGTALVPTFYIYQFLASNENTPVYAKEKATQVLQHHRNALRLAYQKGVLIGAGSDAGSPNTPHPSLHKELLALEEGGLSRIDVLKTATSSAAAILGMAGRLGTVTEGALADLILVRGNPAEKLSVLERPICVISRGKVAAENKRK